MKKPLPVLLMICASLTITHLQASDDTLARTVEGEQIKGFKTKAELDVSLEAWNALATFLQTDPVESNDPEKKAALEKADKEASMSGYNIPANTVVKILKLVKGKDEKDIDEY